MFLYIMIGLVVVLGIFFSVYAKSWPVGLFTIPIGALIFGLVVSSFGGTAHMTTSKHSLQALGNTSGVEGYLSVGLLGGSGEIQDTQVVQYIVKTKAGYSQLKKVNAKKARIYEDESEKPYYIVHTERHPYAEWTGLNFDHENPKVIRIDFHVPKGSVSQDYSIDVNKK